MNKNISIYYASDYELDFNWNLGNKFYVGNSLLKFYIDKSRLNEDKADWFVFVHLDYFNLPSENITVDLANRRGVDLFHLGLELQEGVPGFNEFTRPLWLYNIDVNKEKESTDLKLNTLCFLIRSEAYFSFSWDTPIGIDDVISLGVLWGHKMYTSGYVLRKFMFSRSVNSMLLPFVQPKNRFAYTKLVYGNGWLIWHFWRESRRTGRWLRNLFYVFSAIRLNNSPNKNIIERSSFDFSLEFLKQFRVSIFAPTLDRYPYIRNELIQLNEQTLLPYEVLITDQTIEERRDFGFIPSELKYKVIYQPQDERGQCIAWNYCIENSSGDYCLFLGDDADEIYPDFISDMLITALSYGADVVCCNIKEGDGAYPYKGSTVALSEIFPICLVRRDLLVKLGGYNPAFNLGSRADGELLIRIHKEGGLVLLNPNIKIHHHKAPVGGLRTHGARVVTKRESEFSWRVFNFQSATEKYLYWLHFPESSIIEDMAIKRLALFRVKGSVFKTGIKLLYFLINFKSHRKKIDEVNKKLDILKNENLAKC